MIKLFHGTNRRIKNLRVGSFLSTEFQDASLYASLKDGDVVYEFDCKECDVYRDIHSPQVNWYISNKILQPIKAHSS